MLCRTAAPVVFGIICLGKCRQTGGAEAEQRLAVLCADAAPVGLTRNGWDVLRRFGWVVRIQTRHKHFAFGVYTTTSRICARVDAATVCVSVCVRRNSVFMMCTGNQQWSCTERVVLAVCIAFCRFRAGMLVS